MVSSAFTRSAWSCVCVLAATAAHAQLAINLDDDNVTLQNGNQAPLVVRPGQSFGGTLTPQGFQGVMSDSRGTKMVNPAANPFRDAPPHAAASQGLKINAGGVSLSLPGVASPAMAMTPVPRQRFQMLREMARAKAPAAVLGQVDRTLKEHAADADVLQLKAVLLLMQNRDRDAAACVYDALAMSQPWDWTMLRSTFADSAAATQLYRRLQATVREKPTLEREFVLAWYERMLGHRQEAAEMMHRVAQMRPRDALFQQLQEDWQMTDHDQPPAP